MLEKAQKVLENLRELESRLSESSIISDQARYRDLLRQHKSLKSAADLARRYLNVNRDLQEYQQIAQDGGDEELKQMAAEELPRLQRENDRLEHDLIVALLPKDRDAGRNVIVEIRSGTGGEEAALFAADLYRMYNRYCENRGWKLEVMNTSEASAGGFKEIIFSVSGEEVYQRLKFESGVHRVQRVPATEASGRIHTSAASIAVLAEAEEVDIQINPAD
ncbi:MAG TPA: PCRF domain-containing protein, partial [bacterium]